MTGFRKHCPPWPARQFSGVLCPKGCRPEKQRRRFGPVFSGKTRLPGFSGEWVPRSLGSISAFITKGATPTTYGFGWQSQGVLFLRSECVSDRGLDLSQSMFIAEEAHKVLKRGEVCSGDLLITITGNVGRVIRLSDDFGIANINQHIARIRVTSEHADGRYVYHQLSHPKYLKHFKVNSSM